jgi:hypothetical protein
MVTHLNNLIFNAYDKKDLLLTALLDIGKAVATLTDGQKSFDNGVDGLLYAYLWSLQKAIDL